MDGHPATHQVMQRYRRAARSRAGPSHDTISRVFRLLDPTQFEARFRHLMVNSQRAAARQIIKSGGDYVLALKSSQPALHDGVHLFLDDPAHTGDDADTEVDAAVGRIETRVATVSKEIAWLRDTHAWPGLAAAGQIDRTREVRGEISTCMAYYLLSTPLSTARFNQAVRTHWASKTACTGC